ncbi:unnamed protein product [Protopolystoma xenopodis]|uniref:Uncharacterized protein n=1 Tax=Protopolystoma xenopodis TaxID=117903 RepID=A0A3S5BWV6_9PLAT|nr:unnamed protein product [Protopolystoma xenopodis]
MLALRVLPHDRPSSCKTSSCLRPSAEGSLKRLVKGKLHLFGSSPSFPETRLPIVAPPTRLSLPSTSHVTMRSKNVNEAVIALEHFPTDSVSNQVLAGWGDNDETESILLSARRDCPL